MDLRQNNDLLAYWNKVRAGRPWPKRIEITPSAIAPILPSTFILEVKNANDFTFRLAGSKMCETFGQEFRGQNFLSSWPEIERRILNRHFSQLIDEGTTMRLICTVKSANDDTGDIEILFLPLSHSGAMVDRILGSFSPVMDYDWIGHGPLHFQEIKEVHIGYMRGTSLLAAPEEVSSPPVFIPHKRLVEGKNCLLRVFEGGKID